LGLTSFAIIALPPTIPISAKPPKKVFDGLGVPGYSCPVNRNLNLLPSKALLLSSAAAGF